MGEDTLKSLHTLRIEKNLDALPDATRRAFLFCAQHFQWLKRQRWYLAGGTALALMDGHRQSVDLDFFTPKKSFAQVPLERILKNTGQWKTTYTEKGTLYGLLMKAKMSFIAYPFFHPAQIISYHMAPLLLPQDIAVIKIIAISQRGRKRDFVDLYWYCKKHESLFDVVQRVPQQYPDQNHNMHHILKSLTYFEDAEHDPMPTLFFDASWKNIKTFFSQEVPRIARTIFKLK